MYYLCLSGSSTYLLFSLVLLFLFLFVWFLFGLVFDTFLVDFLWLA